MLALNEQQQRTNSSVRLHFLDHLVTIIATIDEVEDEQPARHCEPPPTHHHPPKKYFLGKRRKRGGPAMPPPPRRRLLPPPPET
ncbi:hypothetical protein niasHT_021308 [Heterodera trifolii]|uniref:Uncharacterized protein n=1 Tax=Heterodera trifolii TaxID=157864 RepID=A0ABD2K392_9BILA